MTKEEIVAEVEAGSRALLKGWDIEPDDRMLAMMNASALRGFQMGARVASSMIKGGMIVLQAQMKATGK